MQGPWGQSNLKGGAAGTLPGTTSRGGGFCYCTRHWAPQLPQVQLRRPGVVWATSSRTEGTWCLHLDFKGLGLLAELQAQDSRCKSHGAVAENNLGAGCLKPWGPSPCPAKPHHCASPQCIWKVGLHPSGPGEQSTWPKRTCSGPCHSFLLSYFSILE